MGKLGCLLITLQRYLFSSNELLGLLVLRLPALETPVLKYGARIKRTG